MAAFERVSPIELADLRGQVQAIGRSQAVIEFALDGTIQTANENFLGAVGYTLGEIRGQHHRMFVEPGERVHCAAGARAQLIGERRKGGGVGVAAGAGSRS